MTTRFLTALVVSACALLASRLPAQADGPDNFIPNQPQKQGATPGNADSQVAKYALLLPSEKSSEAVKEEERNPFGKSDDDVHDVSGKSSNEETKIQEQLSRLHATGLSPGPAGLRVLFGDMWLSKDDVMPPVVKDQTLALRVNEITRDSIQLVWLEKKFTGLPPRTLVIPVDLRATVRRVPHGQLPEKPETTKQESKALKRATAVELPAQIVALGDLSEARKMAKLAQATNTRTTPAASAPAAASGSPASKDAPGVAATAGAPPSPDAPPAAPETKAVSVPTPAGGTTDPLVAGPPAPPAASGDPAPPTQADAKPAGAPPVPAPTEPMAWKRAMGLMENLVKLSEANK
jgi:hypothetical protein